MSKFVVTINHNLPLVSELKIAKNDEAWAEQIELKAINEGLMYKKDSNFEGYFKGGKRQGPGKRVYEDGTIAIGEYSDGVLNGVVKQIQPLDPVKNEKEEYFGQFSNHQKKGFGTIRKLNKENKEIGETFCGIFKDDEKNGYGITYESPGKVIY